MKKIKTEELMEKIAEHQKWLRDKTTGKRLDASFLDFSDVDFSKIDFHGANFHDANFRDADFHDANFYGADFRDANFYGANFHDANFRDADFRDADFYGANFHDANFRDADFHDADFRDADFYGANFRDADFRDADFIGANFRDADFRDADFRDANFSGASNINEVISFANIANTALCMQCPEEGSFIGWKMVGKHIIKLQITEMALRSSATGRKCRCSEALVLSIDDGALQEVINYNFFRTVYKVGEVVRPDRFDTCRWEECTNGIHFFITRKEAEDYCC